jgi:O-antigen ligase
VTSRAFAGRAGTWAGPPLAGRSERRLWIVVGLALAVLLGLTIGGGPANLVLGVMVVGFVLAAYQRVLLAWPTLLGLILVVILFVPIRRYMVGGELPFELEPYRVIIAAVLGCWLCAVAADPRVRVRASGLEAPIGVLLVAMLLSMAANLPRVNAAGATVIKNFTFYLSYILVLYFIVSIVRARKDLDRMIALLVGGGTILAVAALVEWRTSTNFFNWYSHVAPFLHYVDEGIAQERGSGFRARASAQHPIALTAALVMLLPLAIYLYQRHQRRIWLAAAALLTLGALSTGSRTGMVMLAALLVSFLCIRFRDTVRLLPMLLPMLVVIQVGMPGTLGTMKSMLNPSYLIKEQSYDQGASAGRAADLGPALDRWATKPFLGSGFGTTVADPNAPKESEQQILDDQWLGSLLEIGAIGVLALLWLFVRAVRRLTAAARGVTGADAWLAVALAAAIISFAAGMLTFDAFAFIQVTFLAFVLLALSSVAVRALAPQDGQRLRATP